MKRSVALRQAAEERMAKYMKSLNGIVVGERALAECRWQALLDWIDAQAAPTVPFEESELLDKEKEGGDPRLATPYGLMNQSELDAFFRGLEVPHLKIPTGELMNQTQLDNYLLGIQEALMESRYSIAAKPADAIRDQAAMIYRLDSEINRLRERAGAAIQALNPKTDP